MARTHSIILCKNTVGSRASVKKKSQFYVLSILRISSPFRNNHYYKKFRFLWAQNDKQVWHVFGPDLKIVKITFFVFILPLPLKLHGPYHPCVPLLSEIWHVLPSQIALNIWMKCSPLHCKVRSILQKKPYAMTGFAMPRLYELSEHRYSVFSLWCVYTSVYKLLQEKVHFPIRKSISLSLKNMSN